MSSFGPSRSADTRRRGRPLVLHDAPEFADLWVLHQEPSRRVEVVDLFNDGGRYAMLLALVPCRDVGRLPAFHRAEELLVAWVGVDDATAAADDVVVVQGDGG